MKNSLPVLADPDSSLADTLALLAERATCARRAQQARLTRRNFMRGLGSVALLAPPAASWACTLIPAETAGPFPGDGTNGPNVLNQSGIVRSDIRSSFASAGSAVATGTPLTVTLQLVNTNGGCAPLAGYAVYLWHCDTNGAYSLYSAGAAAQNYLRGVQVSDSNGKVTFTTIFPAAYPGRWPHIHFEVYANAGLAVTGRNALRTSQLALPESSCRLVYAQSVLYPGSVTNLNQTTLANDNVFSDDRAVAQLATVSGSVASGFAATLEVGVAGSVVAATAPDINQAGLGGLWYEPASSGQGFALEIYPDMLGAGRGFLQGGWFTFEVAPAGGAEKQRWFSFSGEIATGVSSATVPIYLNTGGNFNAGPITTAKAIGSATLSVSSCTTGQFSYALSDGSGRSGSIPLTRATPNVTCSTSSTRPTNADFALSGNWYTPATSGQGFIVEVNPNAPVVFFAWYTYAVNGQSASGSSGQRWFTGQGLYVAGARTITVTLYETTGGIFDLDTASGQSTTAVGTATLSYQGCSNASVNYAFTSGVNAGQSGSIALARTGSVPAGCVA